MLLLKTEISTADLCDNYSHSIGVAQPAGFKNYGGRKSFFGEICTVKCFENNPLVRSMLETDGTGKVLVVDGGASVKCALLGDNLAQLALDNNWNGVVINGCIRDSAAVSKIAIGVKALDTYPVKSGKKNEGETGVSIVFAGITFTPGQFIYCDEDGIVVSESRLH